MMPKMFASFKKHMISTTSYATKWYITLFANSVPFQTQLRLWDAFLLTDVTCLLLWPWLLCGSSEHQVMHHLKLYYRSYHPSSVPEDEDTLMRWIEKLLEDKNLRDGMRKWGEEWNTLVSQGKEVDALLQRCYKVALFCVDCNSLSHLLFPFISALVSTHAFVIRNFFCEFASAQRKSRA
ncbi:hypothetical protein BD410DRAFT_317929 [Rickenella mellea]|uniref:Rab-GAP TBC domain-containing protein n=1 Tax=Rickenella mellea TaxID=50990 RepID=A0A4Y7PZR5_9AGAM|nr:hypothetical protein BD410DRAFT_317929 [Rickenella mellea]